MYKVNVRAVNTLLADNMICATLREVKGVVTIVFHNDRAFLRQAKSFFNRVAKTGYSKIDNGVIFFEVIQISDLGDGQE